MNAERLHALIDLVLKVHSEGRVGKWFGTFMNVLQNVVSNPQDSAQQTAFVEQRDKLFNILRGTEPPNITMLSPAQKRMLDELGGSDLFGPGLLRQIETILAENVLTPAVAFQKLQELKKRYDSWISAFEQINQGFELLHIEAKPLMPGEAELGLLLPATLYEGKLNGLAEELNILDRALRFVVEATTGETSEIGLRDIAASDPTFYLNLGIPVALAIGGIITWALDTYERILKIQRVSKELASAGDISPETIGSFNRDAETLEQREIERKSKEIIDSASHLSEERKNELANGLPWALEAILARIERGMTLEIRMLPPPIQPADQAGGHAGADAKAAELQQLATIAEQLKFPPVPDKPIIKLPPPKPPGERKNGALEQKPSSGKPKDAKR